MWHSLHITFSLVFFLYFFFFSIFYFIALRELLTGYNLNYSSVIVLSQNNRNSSVIVLSQKIGPEFEIDIIIDIINLTCIKLS